MAEVGAAPQDLDDPGADNSEGLDFDRAEAALTARR